MVFHPILIMLTQILALILIYFPTIAMYFGFKPYQRGFYCNDESIRYPYKTDTVKFYVVGIVGILIPIIIIALTEIFRKRYILKNLSNTYQNFPEVVINIYIFSGIFVFGAGFDQLLTTTGKFVIGRLRPHFIDACKLNFSRINCTNYGYVMIDDSFCSQTNSHILKEMRLSFPSGHSSCSAYCAVAFSIYLMKRWTLPHYLAVWRTLLQAIYICFAILCGLSRISDYKHHWSDVLTGLISGSIVAILVWCYFLGFDTNKDWHDNPKLYPNKVIANKG